MDMNAPSLLDLLEQIQELHRRKNYLVSLHAQDLTSDDKGLARKAIVVVHVANSAAGLITTCYQQLSFGQINAEVAEQLLELPEFPPRLLAQLMMVRAHQLFAFAQAGVNPVVYTQGIPGCMRDTVIPKIKELLDLAERQ